MLKQKTDSKKAAEFIPNPAALSFAN